MKIAFVDHFYHKKTRSSDFFVDIITSGNFVEKYYFDEGNFSEIEENIQLINLKKFDCIIFWQIIPQSRLLDKLVAENIIIIPMYDACFHKTHHYWSNYRKYKFISFSRKLHQKFVALNISSFYIQYFPPTFHYALNSRSEASNNAFIWNRNGSLRIDAIIPFLKKNGISDIMIHDAPDPSNMGFVKKDHEWKGMNVSTTNWFESKSEYLEKVAMSDLYFSPRDYEGIGMSFLEAMSLGLCVVAKNKPTMNEYIIDGYNGVLFNSYKELCSRNIDIPTIKKNTKLYYNEMYNKYVSSIPDLLNYIYSDNNLKENTVNTYWLKFNLLCRDIYHLIEYYSKRLKKYFYVI